MEAITPEQKLKELEEVCLTDKDLLELYKDLINDALTHNNGDIEMAISDTHFDGLNTNPQKDDL